MGPMGYGRGPMSLAPQGSGWGGAIGNAGAAGAAMQQDPSYLAAKRWAGSGGPGVWNSGPVNDAGSPFWQSLQNAQGGASSFTPVGPQENTIQGALQGNGPGTYTGAMQAGPQGWNWNAPSQGALAGRIGSFLGGGGGGPMSLGALARMGMFRR